MRRHESQNNEGSVADLGKIRDNGGGGGGKGGVMFVLIWYQSVGNDQLQSFIFSHSFILILKKKNTWKIHLKKNFLIFLPLRIFHC